MEEVARLVDELQRFCRGHVEGSGERAAGEMLAFVRDRWIEAEEVELASEPLEGLTREELALIVVRDVGELADRLLGTEDPAGPLAWARANLIVDLEHYRSTADPD
jgi:hypothetical protein